MKTILLAGLLVIVLGVTGIYFWRGRAKSEKLTTNSNTMEISSISFTQNGNIPAKYTCDGESNNPHFSISGVSETAKSLAFIMDDPDAPSGTFTHWIMWNIRPDTKEIAENSVPEGAVQGVNSANKNQYSGPCPPSGMHRYFFKVYALDAELNLDKSAKVDQLVAAMGQHIVGQAELMGKYSR